MMSNDPTISAARLHKRQKTDKNGSGDGKEWSSLPSPTLLLEDPGSVVTWNADGLAAKSKNPHAMQQFQSLLAAAQPDVVCIQEARLKCNTTPHNRGVVLASETQVIQPFLSITSESYIPVWSLADKRNAGTCTLIHKRLFHENSSYNKVIAQNCAFSVEGVIELLLQEYNLKGDEELRNMMSQYAASEQKIAAQCKASNGGQTSVKSFFTAAAVSSTTTDKKKKKPKQQQQTSMASFFKPTTSTTCTSTAPPKRSSSAATIASAGRSSSTKRRHLHHEEGRIQFFRFESFDLLNTYVPNNGKKLESYERRRHFDDAMLHLFQVRQAILTKANNSNRPMLWVGDLNVARTYLDGTHHEVQSDGTVQEYWCNEKKCLGRDHDSSSPNHPDNVGMPGFTKKERKRFEGLLQEAKLTDVWRHLHPNGVVQEELPFIGRNGGLLEENRWNRANYTWRGAVARNQAKARYQGKAQRIDYFLLSHDALSRVESCDILGYGEFRQGYFCGSDHCASLLVLKNEKRKDDGNAAVTGDKGTLTPDKGEEKQPSPRTTSV